MRLKKTLFWNNSSTHYKTNRPETQASGLLDITLVLLFNSHLLTELCSAIKTWFLSHFFLS